jgi:hypothetical protein
VTSLRKRSDGGAMLREELLKCYVDDADIKVRNAAAVTLAQLGAPSESFLQALRCNVAGDDRQAHKAARLALDLLKK